MTMRLFHGGVPGLRPGDLIEPGHERQVHDGCEWCASRAALTPQLDGLPLHEDRVYLTPERSYARYYASLYGRGDLYQVEPIGHIARNRWRPLSEVYPDHFTSSPQPRTWRVLGFDFAWYPRENR